MENDPNREIIEKNLEFLTNNLFKNAIRNGLVGFRTRVSLIHDKEGRIKGFDEGGVKIRLEEIQSDYILGGPYNGNFVIEALSYHPATRSNGVINLWESARDYNSSLGMPKSESGPSTRRKDYID